MTNQEPNKTQIEAALEHPAVYTNKFYFSYMGSSVRIAFCEQIFEENHPLHTEKPRGTIILPFEEFVKFGNEIMKVLSFMQEQKLANKIQATVQQ